MTRSQMSQVLQSLNSGLTEDAINNLFDYVDKNGNGVIDYSEFVDFIYAVEEAPSQAAERRELNKKDSVSREQLGKAFDVSRWQKALSGGAWGFACDHEASAIRLIVEQFPDIETLSPEGLTLAEEFALIWLDEETGELAEYSYFGKDEPFHNALFGAILIGLRARGCLSFKERKCRWTGKAYELVLSGEAPADSQVLAAAYEELASESGQSLKSWFERKSGKWGEDQSTKLTLQALVDRGVLEPGRYGDAYTNATFKVKERAVVDALQARLQAVTKGDSPADGRSLALLALCRTADRRDPATNNLMRSVFAPEDVAAMTARVDVLVKSSVSFRGIGAEELNKMIDALPGEKQQLFESREFEEDVHAQFSALDTKGEGRIHPVSLAKVVDTQISGLVREKLGISEEGMQTVISLFDSDQDGFLEEETFKGFLMWCHALECLT
eukprot:CAMPEP_0171078002 /NCGR_PEP_ID=MMETSP0766_2-20121228/14381_1 /TAXON_ID=439317 /ORGANISM="Gambierdiscus australes, Strain CAWD 149" /LENGTH=441 /DNA_ID=CAMNT_0011535097 /DNA_START=41 /DNA_END=1366 /DNA_ORIENTATION=+